MSDGEERIQVLYELSLSIGPAETLEATVDRALSSYLKKLDCSVGAVFERVETPTGTGYETVGTIPTDPWDGEFRAARDRIPDGVDSDAAFRDSLPRIEQTETASYCLMALPGYGLLALGRRGEELDPRTISALTPLNQKLADACEAKRAEARLREERNRFEGVFNTMTEPLVNVVEERGEPVIRGVNDAFEETFGYAEATARGRRLTDLIVPDTDGQRAETATGETEEYVAFGQSLSREVRRSTQGAVGDFLFRSVPVGTETSREYIGMYVEVTDDRDRQRTFEQLYRETERILAGEDRATICERTIAAVEEVIGIPLAAVHLYDRSEEGLTPVATSERLSEAADDWSPVYRDRGTTVWETYQRGEPTQVIDGELVAEQLPGDDVPAESAAVYPLSSHGVLVLAATDREVFDSAGYFFGRLLSATVATALDRARREQGLAAVRDVTQEVLTAETHEQMAERALERLPYVLDFPLSAIWEYNDIEERLHPVAQTEAAESIIGEPPVFESDSSIAWRAFDDDELKVVSRTTGNPDAYDSDSPIESEVISPIGEFGVFAAGSTRGESFTALDRQLVETLTANLRTAARLIDRREDLRLLDEILARILRHNLRNKLTTIQGNAEYIRDSVDQSLQPMVDSIIKACQKVEETAEQAREMRTVVNDDNDTTTVSLRQAVEQSLEELRSEFPAVTFQATFESTPTVVAHPTLVAAIRQLARNGAEHHTLDRPPVVEVTVFESNAGPAVEVTDNGPGIPAHELDIFEMDSESDLQHGSGAGLWLVDRLADYSNASVEFTVDDGTTVRLTFPH